MKIFKLPDLGEGLPDAVVREWHVQEGDHIAAHQSLVTVETAKALVEVPAPWGGTVEKLFAAADETVNVGEPLVGFKEAGAPEPEAEEEAGGREPAPAVERADSGTVVGKIEQSGAVLGAEVAPSTTPRRLATPAVRALARRLAVDLTGLQPRGERFTAAEVRAVAQQAPAAKAAKPADKAEPEKAQMSPARRAMALAMSRARDQVAPMTLCDQVDISAWWGKESATLRLIRALQQACADEPNLNALYQDEQLRPAASVNIGLAVDSPRGLFVPVLKDVAARTDDEILQQIEDYKEQARNQGIAQQDLQDGTILLSNFGAMAGRYATPVVLPPTVAIVGAGRTFQGVVAVDDRPAVRPLLPLSVSADHRAVTGGELARFLKSMLQALSR
ncbi:dihydrolipoamide acetyltransferase family protein [Microbulbifer marinus]|uniref:Dihydrolipoamide acetyltransferase component of pyruvate dehydrogenase complex n=1 Tax=Microbulbifer marinus TaxID=658218 RepID=A0A1H3Z161_9GAMM|nr:dihydrolipoamide acetyltransferase family protein [Microbulbifer marinus]SEA17583.1 pyruvate dehydrogenase E2 component (dihydrolipoamide acetyltransferase) [Microbulbifer marinus]